MVSFAYFASLCLRRQAACSITETARTLHDAIHRRLQRRITPGYYWGPNYSALQEASQSRFKAENATSSDPANRLGLRATYNDAAGNCAGGIATFMCINILADQLNDVSRAFPIIE